MTLADATLSEDSIAAARAQPAFRSSCELAAAKALACYEAHPPTLRWVLKDIGRFGIGITAMVLQSIDRLTFQALIAACLDMGVSSAGRVRQLVERCAAAGELELVPESGLRRTRSRIVLAPSFYEAFEQRARVEVQTAVAFYPELAPMLDVLATRAGFLAYCAASAMVTTSQREFFTFNDDTPVNFFFQREAGGMILYDFLTRQPADRERLLDGAPLSRNALARRFDVSRAHVNKLLGEAARRGYLTLPNPNRIEFAPAFSDGMEWRMASIFLLQRASWQILKAGAASGAL